jgi:hypothetical protein
MYGRRKCSIPKPQRMTTRCDYWANYPGGPRDFDYTVVKGYAAVRALIAQKESAK